MNSKLLKAALEKIQSVPVLINMVSKREKHYTALDVYKSDVALAEIAQGKLIAQVDFDAIAKAEEAKSRWNMKHANVNSLYAD